MSKYIKFMFFAEKKIETLFFIGAWFLPLIFLLGNTGIVYSRADAVPTSAGYTDSAPINIISDRMEADSKEKWIEFIGNVVAKQEDSIITAERLKIFYISDNGDATDSETIKKIIADGNVNIVTGTKRAAADHAVYTVDSHVLVLTGNSRAWSGKNIVTGNKITLFLNENRSIVESGEEEQVEATFYPKKEGGLLK